MFLIACAAFLPTRRSADAQQSKIPRIGLLVDAQQAKTDPRGLSALVQSLRDLGWEVGRSVDLEIAYSEADAGRLPGLAANLVQREVDIIWSVGPRSAVAAARATKTIPIVFWGVSAPVELGLIGSLARPGGNVTGIAYTAGLEVNSKILELLKVAAPQTIRVAELYGNTANIDLRWATGMAILESAARDLKMEMRRFEVRAPDDFETIFRAVLAWRAHAVLVHGDPMTWSERQRIVDFTNRNGLAGGFGMHDFAIAGGLFAYSPDLVDGIRQSARYFDKILRGTKAADLPVEQPTKLYLTINLKTAKALGLTIPPSLLLRADQVIE
jgi:putative ABC transport system substrate-binding protein